MNPLIEKTKHVIEWIKFVRSKIPARLEYEVYSLVNTFFAGAATEVLLQWNQTSIVTIDEKTAKWAFATVCIRSGIKAVIEAWLALRGKDSPIVSANR